MLIRNLMEDKQLNFNQPLLSVRRYASTVVAEKDEKRGTKSSFGHLPRPPPYKSELKSGPVRNPGVVPFVWEQSPGRPKNGSTPQKDKIGTPSSTAPKLPPGRTPKANKQDSDNPPSNPIIHRNEIGNPDVSQGIPSVDHGVECFEDVVEEEEENSDSRDGSDIYVDALDTLSRTESFFLNCSVSGVSGLVEQDVKPFGIFSTDLEARDFMIGRFLPAAKAMVSETQTPQYIPKKQSPVVQEQPRQLKKVVNADKKPQLRYGPSFVHHYTQSQYSEEAEEESDDDYEQIGNLQTKVCGLVPRFCLRSSFCLLNPVPGMSVRTRIPMSPASRVHDTKSSSASTCSKTENEQYNLDVSEQRSTDGSQTTEQHEEKNGSNHNKPMQICSDSQKIEDTYPHKQFKSNSTEDTRSFIFGDIGSQNKNYTSFKELLANQSNSMELGSPAVEKTLYIDSESGFPERKELTRGRNKENHILKMEVENIWRDLESVEKLSLVNGVKKPSNFQKPHDLQDFEKGLSKANSASLEVPSKETTESFQKQQTQKQLAKVDNSQGKYGEFPTPPPLPKSPSDSWLYRTLPSMSSKNAHNGIGTHPRNHHQTFKTQSTTDAKWEMIVKTTNVHQHNFRYAEELLPPISET